MKTEPVACTQQPPDAGCGAERAATAGHVAGTGTAAEAATEAGTGPPPLHDEGSSRPHTGLLTTDLGLPERWQGRSRFVVLETGFGWGRHFLATWHAWQQDDRRCERLHYVAIEPHPLPQQHLHLAHRASPWPTLAAQLLQAWPPHTSNLHTLEFDRGQVQLLLAFGDATSVLPGLRLTADAMYLQGLTAAGNTEPWPLRLLKALGRRAAPGATLAGRGPLQARPALLAGLKTAGFAAQAAAARVTGGANMASVSVCDDDDGDGDGNDSNGGNGGNGSNHSNSRASTRPSTNSTGVGDGFAVTRAVYQPRAPSRAPPMALQPLPASPHRRTAVVVGAGLAGAAVAQALARQGLQVTVLEAQASAASQGSGNLAGLFHGTVHGADGIHARLYRAAALHAARTYALAIAGGVPGQQAGLLRLQHPPGGLPEMQALVHRHGWPAAYVQALDAAAASQCAGTALPSPAWWYPGGGWISPPHWVQAALATPGVQLVTRCAVAALQRQSGQWLALDANGQGLARADVVVLSHTHSAAALLQRMGHAAWPLVHTRGQVTHWPDAPDNGLRLPVAGDGYAVPLHTASTAEGSHPAAPTLRGLLCGATSTEGEPEANTLPAVTDEDHRHNLQRLQRLTGMAPPPPGTPLLGRAAWRLNTNDRLPIAGAVPLPLLPTGQRHDQARLLPREPGLFVLTALGARGLTLAPLLAQLVAAQACQAPWPLEQDLADAVDPARWRVRTARRQIG